MVKTMKHPLKSRYQMGGVMATAAILEPFLKILEVLDCIAEDSHKREIEEKQVILQIKCKS